jgi:formylglycine-generating enzyme required for sulfatase activity
VTIGYAFAVSKYPITRGEWKRFVRETGHEDSSDSLKDQQHNHPVVVRWQDAMDYAAWLSRKTSQRYRLPSEAEYEYMNRAGSQTAYGTGAFKQRNFYTDLTGTWPVGSFRPNAFGLYDTTGHVWCWALDTYHPDYNGAPADGSAWEQGGYGRVVRGGAWNNNPEWLRVAARGFGNEFEGFRLARI